MLMQANSGPKKTTRTPVRDLSASHGFGSPSSAVFVPLYLLTSLPTPMMNDIVQTSR